MNHSKEKISDLVNFVRTEAKKANDPVCGRFALKQKAEREGISKPMVFANTVEANVKGC